MSSILTYRPIDADCIDGYIHFLKEKYNASKNTLFNNIVYLSNFFELLHGLPQERNIVQLMHQGLSNKEIAARLGIALSTLKTHIHHIYRKLQVSNRMQAVQRANLKGLLDENVADD